MSKLPPPKRNCLDYTLYTWLHTLYEDTEQCIAPSQYRDQRRCGNTGNRLNTPEEREQCRSMWTQMISLEPGPERDEETSNFLLLHCCGKQREILSRDEKTGCLKHLVEVYNKTLDAQHRTRKQLAAAAGPSKGQVLRSGTEVPRYERKTDYFIQYKTDYSERYGRILRDAYTLSCRYGVVYSFTSPSHPGFVKVGYSSRHQDRMLDWRQCHKDLVESTKCYVSYPETVETLIHWELEIGGYRRQIASCKVCVAPHIEWFELSLDNVNQVMKSWVDLVNEEPFYKQDGKVRPEWKEAIELSNGSFTAKSLRNHLLRKVPSPQILSPVKEYTGIPSALSSLPVQGQVLPHIRSNVHDPLRTVSLVVQTRPRRRFSTSTPVTSTASEDTSNEQPDNRRQIVDDLRPEPSNADKPTMKVSSRHSTNDHRPATDMLPSKSLNRDHCPNTSSPQLSSNRCVSTAVIPDVGSFDGYNTSYNASEPHAQYRSSDGYSGYESEPNERVLPRDSLRGQNPEALREASRVSEPRGRPESYNLSDSNEPAIEERPQTLSSNHHSPEKPYITKHRSSDPAPDYSMPPSGLGSWELTIRQKPSAAADYTENTASTSSSSSSSSGQDRHLETHPQPAPTINRT